MAEPRNKPEIYPHKKVIKLAPALGDWTTYKPVRLHAKRIRSGISSFDRLSKEDVDIALKIHYEFFSAFLKKLKTDLRLYAQMHIMSAEQNTYYQYLKTISFPAVQNELNLEGFENSLPFILDLNIANSLINHALGSFDLENHADSLNDTEKNILQTILEEYWALFTESFSNIFPKPKSNILGTLDINLDHTINPSASFIFFACEASVGDNSPANIIIGYPSEGLKHLLNKIKQKVLPKPLNFNRFPKELLNKIKIPISVKLGETIVKARDLGNLEKGDCLDLDSRLDQVLTVKINEEIVLSSQPGKKDNRLCARIISLIKDESIRVEPVSVIEEEKESLPQPEEEKFEEEIAPEPLQEEEEAQEEELEEEESLNEENEESELGEEGLEEEEKLEEEPESELELDEEEKIKPREIKIPQPNTPSSPKEDNKEDNDEFGDDLLGDEKWDEEDWEDENWEDDWEDEDAEDNPKEGGK